MGEGLTPAVKATARKTSIGLLNRLLGFNPEEDPAIVLMSSEQVKARAQMFRQGVEKLGGNVLAVRFLQKGWISTDGTQLKIDHQGADALLDTSQGFIFGQVLHKTLKEWKGGAEKALQAVLKEIGSLESKDFVYLFRFRLASEGERMGDYLEWLFGENLRALLAEKVNWQSESFKQIDDQGLSKGIEGAFEGPSVPIARLFQRVRVDEHEKGAAAGRKNTWYEYLVFDGAVASVEVDDLDVGLDGRKFTTGSLLKLYSYRLPEGSKSIISRDFSVSLNDFLFEPALPFLTVDNNKRYPDNKASVTAVYGLKRRLEADGETLEA